MAVRKNQTPHFFSEEPFDPVAVATGQGGQRDTPDSARFKKESPQASGHVSSAAKKKKAGFYLSIELLDRFARKYYELKLAGATIKNQSALLELALSFALDDLDKGINSQVLKTVRTQ